jgi:hypothetical protein
LRKKILIPILILIFLAIPLVNPQSGTTQILQSLEGNLKYIKLTEPDLIYSQRLLFSPPDGVSKITVVEIILQGDFQEKTIIKARLNERYCEPDHWETPSFPVAGYKATFDCTSLSASDSTIIKDMTFDFSTSIPTTNVKGWYKINYYNDWKLAENIAKEVKSPKMSIFGTDYYIGDYGKVWLQLLDANDKNVDNATCFLDVYYPFGNKYIERAVMNFLDEGIYYYDLIIPNIIGIYPTTALCYYMTAIQTETADSGYINIGTLDSGSYVSTQIKDNVFWKIDELKVSGIHRLDFGENFTSINPPALLTEIQVLWSGKWNGGLDYLTLYIYNFTSSSWLSLANTIPDTGGARIDISNSIAITNATESGLLSINETRIRIIDTTSADATKSKIQTDYLAVNLVRLSNPSYIETRGASEINVKSSEASKYLIVETSCEEIKYGSASVCGELVNYNMATNYTENEILENITVTSLASLNSTDTCWEYWTPITFDCTAIYWIKYKNGTNWIDVTDQAEMHSHLTDENCHIKFPLTVDIGETYEYAILMDNYQKWEVQWTKNVRDVVYMLIYPPCIAYANLNNYTYTVPILDGTFVNNTDTQLGGCHRFLDDIYWIDLYYNLSLNATNVADYSSYYLELRWYETALRQHNQLYNSEIANVHYQFSVASNQSIYNKIGEVNNSIIGEMYSIHNDLISINQSIMGKLYSIQVELAGIYNLSNQINQTVSNFSTNLTSISNLIREVNISINERLNNINSSIFAKLYSIQEDLSDIVNRLINLTSLVEGANSSVMGKLHGIQGEINGLGAQIDSVNNTIMGKLYIMQDEIASVNSSVINTNTSVMNKLYSIQDDLNNLLNNLTIQLANVSNFTFNITTDLSKIAGDVWELFFIRGTPPLAPSTSYYCKDPETLVKNITYDYKGQAFEGYFTKTEDVPCSYGCINGTVFSTHAYCDYDPSTKTGIALLVVVAIIISLYVILKKTS